MLHAIDKSFLGLEAGVPKLPEVFHGSIFDFGTSSSEVGVVYLIGVVKGEFISNGKPSSVKYHKYESRNSNISK